MRAAAGSAPIHAVEKGPEEKACLSLCSQSPGVPLEGSEGKACLSLCSLSPGVP